MRFRLNRVLPIGASVSALVLVGSLLALAGGTAAPSGPAQALGGTVAAGCTQGEPERYLVPEGVDRVRISAGGGSGAAGADGKARGGKGGLVEGTFPVTPGEEILVTVGCSANGQQGGAGFARGGNGGNSTAYNNGGGGGGSTAVQRGSSDDELTMLIVAPGGGGGGGSGYANTGARGQDGGPNSQYDRGHWVAENGWRSTGGAGGGGAGAGAPGFARPGDAGRGGSSLGDWGGSGKGGRTYVDRNGASDIREVDGGAPYGSGFAIVTFLERGGIVPLASTFPCAAGVSQPYTVPADVHRLEIVATGGSGSNNWATGHGGAGARVTGSLAVSPGQTFSVVAGCGGGFKSGGAGYDHLGGAGYGKGGDGGNGPSGGVAGLEAYGGGGGGSSALLFDDGAPVIVAGGGGGAGGVAGSGGTAGGAGSATGESGQRGDAAGGAGGAAGGKDGLRGSNGPLGGAGGGGGGGFRGGDGGNAGAAGENGGAGGGGSSYAAAELEGSAITTGGGGDGNGFVLILAVIASAPSPVQSASAVPRDGSAEISFAAPASDGNSAIREYIITSSSGTVMRTTEPGTVVFPRLSNGTGYTFSIVAVNAIGPSPEVTVWTRPRTVPAVPGSVQVGFGDQRLFLTFDAPWDGGSPITSYTVLTSDGRRYTVPGGPVSIVGLSNGTEYGVSIFASNAAGDGPMSAWVTEVPRAVPDAPTIVTAYPDAGSIDLVVQPGDANGAPITSYLATAYPVLPDEPEEPEDPENPEDPEAEPPGERIAIGDPVTGVVTFTSLTDGVEYVFTVRAVNSVGTGPASAPYGPVQPSSLPSAPINLVATAGDGSVTIAFDPPLETHGEPVLEYRVYGADGSFLLSADDSPITIEGLTNGTQYAFQLRARTALGLGHESAAVFATPVPRPANDNEANAIVLDPAGGTTTGSTVNATTEPEEVAPGIGTTVWYSLSIPSGVGGAYRIDLCDSPGSATLDVYGGYGAVGEAHDCAGGGSAPFYITDVPGSGLTLLIQVDAVDAPGEFALNWRSLGG